MEVDLAIEIDKAIPAGAGLGGGSSDAGAVLRGLAQLLPGRIDTAALATLALGLGADVPFFLDPRPARVSGIGERIEPAEGVPALAVLVVHPGISVETAAVYAAWDRASAALTPPEARPTMPAFLEPVRALAVLEDQVGGANGKGNPARADPFSNDLEAMAVALCPEIGALRRRIDSLGAIASGMSGSGSTVFGVFENRQRAEEALEDGEFGAPVWARVSETIASPRSPLRPA